MTFTDKCKLLGFRWGPRTSPTANNRLRAALLPRH